MVNSAPFEKKDVEYNVWKKSKEKRKKVTEKWKKKAIRTGIKIASILLNIDII